VGLLYGSLLFANTMKMLGTMDEKLKNHLIFRLCPLSALLEALKTNPVPWRDFDLKKIVGAENTYRGRIGDYRVVYFIEKEMETIHILKFELRGTVYKR